MVNFMTIEHAKEACGALSITEERRKETLGFCELSAEQADEGHPLEKRRGASEQAWARARGVIYNCTLSADSL